LRPVHVKLSLIAGIFSAGISSASAQSMGDVFTLFGGIVRERMVQTARQSWAGVSPAELACLQQVAQQQGTTVQALIQSGIGPNDGRVASWRAKCSPAAHSGGPARPASPYMIDGLRLGDSVSLGSPEYASYACSPSQQFVGFTWCQRRKKEQGSRGAFQSVNSILHQPNGTTAYVSRYIEPAYFANKEVQAEIQRLSGRFGKAAKMMSPPQLAGMKEAVIAVWADVELVPLDPESIAILAGGKSVTKGLLFDFLGDFERSAKAGLPVYQLAGGSDYLWSASVKENGQGHLRLTAVDVSRLSGKPEAPAVVAEPPPAAQVPAAPEPFSAPPFKRDAIGGQTRHQAWPGPNVLPDPQAGAAPRLELLALHQRIAGLLAAMPEGSPERATSLINVANIARRFKRWTSVHHDRADQRHQSNTPKAPPLVFSKMPRSQPRNIHEISGAAGNDCPACSNQGLMNSGWSRRNS
jgi:hypothetical protein